MWRYVFSLLGRQRGKSLLAGSGFLLAACALILLSATTQTTVVQANQIISQSWRPTYDLVVLPSGVKMPTGQNVPADFLQSYDGGISMQQYERIKQISGVSIAAPIAYIGYVSLPAPHVYFPSNHLLNGYYQLNWTLTAFNGQRNIVEYQDSTVYQVAPCVQVYNAVPVDDVIKYHENMQTDCPISTPQYHPILNFATPHVGTFLLAAIDPVAESQLLHLDKSVTNGRMLTEQDTVHLDQRVVNSGGHFANPITQKPIPADAIPLLIHQNLPGQITLVATLTELSPQALSAGQLQKLGGAAYLRHLPNQKTIFHGVVPLALNDPERFTNTRLTWDGHGWQALPVSANADLFSSFNYLLDFSSASTPVGLSYRATTAADGESAYSLVPIGTQGPEVAFRQLQPLQLVKKPWRDVVYTYEEVGQFANAGLEAEFSNPLNWLPENTYTPPPVALRYDVHGHPVTPTTLVPTTNRAGYVVQPPLALTTLAAAQQLKGNGCISAIRIRVSGVDAANPASWKRVQQVAALIHETTHLQVLVTLGSSPRPTLVYVPGIQSGQFGAKQDIAPIGWVEERWIAIGASILYLAQLGAMRLLLLAAVLAVCLGYLVVAFSALVTSQRTEFAVLSALGWRPGQTTRLFLAQALLLALGGGIVGIGIALLATTLLEAVPIWLIVTWTLPAMLVLALLSSLYPLWQLWRIRPAEILRAGSSVSATAAGRAGGSGLPLWSVGPVLGALVLRNLGRSRSRTVLMGISLFLSAVLLVLMFSGILALRQTLVGTLLGNFVLLQTAVPQIAGCVFAVLLTFLSVADLLLLQVRERQREIGLLQAVGWRTGQVQRLFVQEGLLLAVLATLPGVLVAQGILIVQHNAQNIIPPPLVALAAMLFMVLVAALATLPALRVVSRMQVAEVLRNE